MEKPAPACAPPPRCNSCWQEHLQTFHHCCWHLHVQSPALSWKKSLNMYESVPITLSASSCCTASASPWRTASNSQAARRPPSAPAKARSDNCSDGLPTTEDSSVTGRAPSNLPRFLLNSAFTVLLSSQSYLGAASKKYLEKFPKITQKGPNRSASPHKMLHPNCPGQHSEEFPSKKQLDLLVRWTLITFKSILLALGTCDRGEVDRVQPWGSTSQGWERRPETGEPGLHSQEQALRVDGKKGFLLFLGNNRDAIPPWPQHSAAAELPTFGKSTWVSTARGQGMRLTLEKPPSWS